MNVAKFACVLAACWSAGLAAFAQAPMSPPRDASPRQQPINEEAAAAAWNAYQAGDFKAAITNADRCIQRFRDAADRSQETLQAAGTTLPVGTVSEPERQTILQYGILHDVAACYLIKGWAEEKLGRREQARAALAEAKRYPLARKSTNGTEFWAPADKAANSLARLESVPPK